MSIWAFPLPPSGLCRHPNLTTCISYIWHFVFNALYFSNCAVFCTQYILHCDAFGTLYFNCAVFCIVYFFHCPAIHKLYFLHCTTVLALYTVNVTAILLCFHNRGVIVGSRRKWRYCPCTTLGYKCITTRTPWGSLCTMCTAVDCSGKMSGR